MTGDSTWAGPYATESTAGIQSWRGGLSGSADAMMATAARWERAAAGFNDHAADLRREASAIQRAADQQAARQSR